jgi:MFS family permease
MTIVVFTPLYGKFSDIFGRKVCMLFSLFCFSVGSLGCGLATNIVMLIVFRAIAGIGGGGIISVSFVMISDVTTLENRPLYFSVINITFAVSGMLGPILGGIIVDHIGWRFVFYINLPVAGILALIVIFIMPFPWVKGSLMSKLKRIDVLGVLTLSVSIILFVLSTTWGGKHYAWSSYQVLIPLILTFIALIAFIYIEVRVAVEPLLPPKMFNSNVIICCCLGLVLGINHFMVIYYLPVYYQVLRGYTASESGYQLAPFLVSVSIVSMFSGIIGTKLQSFRIFIWVGTVLMVIGSGLLCLTSDTLPHWCMIFFPIILAFGIGFSIQMVLISAQASSQPEYIAILASFLNFTFCMGATVGLAIAGAIVNNLLADFPYLVGTGGHEGGEITQPMSIEGQLAYYGALRGIFYFLLGISAFGFIISTLLKHRSSGALSTPGY